MELAELFIKVLQNPNFTSPMPLNCIAKEETEFHEYKFLYEEKCQEFYFIETPAFLESNSPKKEDNLEMEKVFESVLKRTNNLHLVFILISTLEEMKRGDLQLIGMVFSLFKGYEENIKLIVNNSENLSAQERENRRERLANNPELSVLIGEKRHSIFFSGSLCEETGDLGTQRENLKETKEELMSMLLSEEHKPIKLNQDFFQTNLSRFICTERVSNILHDEVISEFAATAPPRDNHTPIIPIFSPQSERKQVYECNEERNFAEDNQEVAEVVKEDNEKIITEEIIEELHKVPGTSWKDETAKLVEEKVEQIKVLTEEANRKGEQMEKLIEKYQMRSEEMNKLDQENKRLTFENVNLEEKLRKAAQDLEKICEELKRSKEENGKQAEESNKRVERMKRKMERQTKRSLADNSRKFLEQIACLEQDNKQLKKQIKMLQLKTETERMLIKDLENLVCKSVSSSRNNDLQDSEIALSEVESEDSEKGKKKKKRGEKEKRKQESREKKKKAEKKAKKPKIMLTHNLSERLTKSFEGGDKKRKVDSKSRKIKSKSFFGPSSPLIKEQSSTCLPSEPLHSKVVLAQKQTRTLSSPLQTFLNFSPLNNPQPPNFKQSQQVNSSSLESKSRSFLLSLDSESLVVLFCEDKVGVFLESWKKWSFFQQRRKCIPNRVLLSGKKENFFLFFKENSDLVCLEWKLGLMQHRVLESEVKTFFATSSTPTLLTFLKKQKQELNFAQIEANHNNFSLRQLEVSRKLPSNLSKAHLRILHSDKSSFVLANESAIFFAPNLQDEFSKILDFSSFNSKLLTNAKVEYNAGKVSNLFLNLSNVF